MKRLLALLLLAAGLPVQALFADAPKYGILLVSPGSGPDFNSQVTALRDRVDKKVPTEVSFGLYVGVAQIMDLQNGVNRLAARGVKKIVVVPLLLEADSQDMDQLRYAFGLADNPAAAKEGAQESNPMAGAQAGSANIGAGSPIQSTFPGQSGDQGGDQDRVHTQLPLVLEGALENAPQAADILLARAKALSEDPSRATVILLGKGSSDDAMNKAQLRTLQALADAVKQKSRFAAVEAATLREDASQDVKDEARRHLRALVDAADLNGGSAVVVPAMMSLDNLDQPVSQALDGDFYSWNGRTILPDPRLEKWVLAEGADGAALPDVRKYK